MKYKKILTKTLISMIMKKNTDFQKLFNDNYPYAFKYSISFIFFRKKE